MIAFRGVMLATSIILCMLPSADAFPSDNFSSETITLDKPVHFSAPDGSDIVTVPGDYQVAAESSALRLLELAGKRSFRIHAIVTDLDVDTNEPVVLAIRFGEDEYHIILLMTGRKVHEAVGSSSGILARGTMYKPLTAAQIKAALRTKRTSSP
jgi:hypothetical protein